MIWLSIKQTKKKVKLHLDFNSHHKALHEPNVKNKSESNTVPLSIALRHRLDDMACTYDPLLRSSSSVCQETMKASQIPGLSIKKVIQCDYKVSKLWSQN